MTIDEREVRVAGTVRAVIGLGANLGDSRATLAAAVAALAALPGAQLVGVSSLYESRPVGPSDQPSFHNAAVALDVPAGPDPVTGALALLVALKRLEAALGRLPGRMRWGPRQLDLDLLVFGDAQVALTEAPAGLAVDLLPDPGKRGSLLELPHPEAGNRLFVLAPWADLAPEFVPPGWTTSVAGARDAREPIEGGDVRRIAAWDPATRTWSEGFER